MTTHNVISIGKTTFFLYTHFKVDLPVWVPCQHWGWRCRFSCSSSAASHALFPRLPKMLLPTVERSIEEGTCWAVLRTHKWMQLLRFFSWDCVLGFVLATRWLLSRETVKVYGLWLERLLSCIKLSKWLMWSMRLSFRSNHKLSRSSASFTWRHASNRWHLSSLGRLSRYPLIKPGFIGYWGSMIMGVQWQGQWTWSHVLSLFLIPLILKINFLANHIIYNSSNCFLLNNVEFPNSSSSFCFL